jgi:hypothetical protein
MVDICYSWCRDGQRTNDSKRNIYVSTIYRILTTTGHISQKVRNKLLEDDILNAETCRNEKIYNYIE